jgi:hypothetical protein
MKIFVKESAHANIEDNLVLQPVILSEAAFELLPEGEKVSPEGQKMRLIIMRRKMASQRSFFKRLAEIEPAVHRIWFWRLP